MVPGFSLLSTSSVPPFSVLLLVTSGVNAVIGFFYRAVMMGDISDMAWKYFALSVPVAAVSGPVGSFLGSHLHRQSQRKRSGSGNFRKLNVPGCRECAVHLDVQIKSFERIGEFCCELTVPDEIS
ncbi:hypothetical protein OSTOST_24137, partial [Ostertagia ostertagi]